MVDKTSLDWNKVTANGLLPAVVQHAETGDILMLGYMDEAAFEKTKDSGKATFYSRSKDALWVKGEKSGNFLHVKNIHIDCDSDTILLQCLPDGPACHKGTISCFGDAALLSQSSDFYFLKALAGVIHQRNKDRPKKSYTTKLFKKGRGKIAQKVGEEGVELALAHAMKNRDEVKEEAADLFYHVLVLLEDSGVTLDEVCALMKERHHNIPMD